MVIVLAQQRKRVEMTRLLSFIGTTGSIQIWICFAAGACCFSPLMLHPSNNQGITVLKFALTSHQNRDSAIAALALTTPIFIEITSEIIVSFLKKNDATKGDIRIEQEVLNLSERLALVCGIITVPIAAFLPSETANLVDIYSCLRKCRSMLVSGAIIISLCRYDPKIWSVGVTYVILLLLAAGTITGAYAAVVDAAANIGSALFITGVAVFYICNARWINTVLPKLTKVMSLSNAVQDVSLKEEGSAGITDILFQLFYIISFTMISVVIIASQISFRGIDVYSPSALFYNNLAFLLYLLLIIYISKRKMKFKVVRGLVSSSLIALIEMSLVTVLLYFSIMHSTAISH